MKRVGQLLLPVLLTGVTSVLAAHDLFPTSGRYFVAPQTAVTIGAPNGTFSSSENDSMTRSTEPDVDYPAHWATLTFGIAPRTDAILRNGEGTDVGRVSLRDATGGVEVRVTASGLTPGGHGVHLHAAPVCEGPAFQTSGGHLNPSQKQHGHQNPAGPHQGDLGNLDAGTDGSAVAVLMVAGTTVRQLVGDGGISLMIHAAPDDEKTDPSGGSGARVACAVLR